MGRHPNTRMICTDVDLVTYDLRSDAGALVEHHTRHSLTASFGEALWRAFGFWEQALRRLHSFQKAQTIPMEKLRLQACGTGPMLAPGSGGTKHVVFGPDGFDSGHLCDDSPFAYIIQGCAGCCPCMRFGFFFLFEFGDFCLTCGKRGWEKGILFVQWFDASTAGLWGAYTWRLAIIHGPLLLY